MADIEFMDISAATITEKLITGVEDRLSVPLYPGDERRLLLEALAPAIVQIINEADDNCKQRLLAYARNDVLDALGDRMNTSRLQASPAKTVLRFSVAEKRDRSTFIPQGTRATADGSAHFATMAAVTIPAGALYVDVAAECTTPGAAFNGYSVGAISTITDLIPYVAGVTNIEASHDGDDGEPMDSGGDGDNRYRERIRLAPAKLSTAGPEASYIYHALSASPLITDVKPLNDHDAGTVELIIMTEDGSPSEDIIEAVQNACNDISVRPLNDLVIVNGPERVQYDINIKYYTTAENEQATVAAIENAGGALDKFNEWQQQKIGRDINPDKLRAFCLAPTDGTGALRMEITAPVFTSLTERQLAKFSGILTVTHEVTEE
jgi:phage-related baseplate assembly protein